MRAECCMLVRQDKGSGVLDVIVRNAVRALDATICSVVEGVRHITL